MAEAQQLADAIRRSVHGPAWHGPALLEILDEVSADQANARPLAQAHTIAEIVMHVMAWDYVSLRTVVANEPQPEEPWSGDWPAVTQPWSEMVEGVAQLGNELARAVEHLTPERLTATVPGRTFDLRFLLSGLPEHHAYHGGQISLLRKGLPS